MLRSLFPPERRRLSAAACGLLSLAVLAVGVAPRASAAPTPPADPNQPRADEPAPPAAPDVLVPDLDDFLKDLPPGTNPDVLQALREHLRMAQQMQRRFGQPGAGAPVGPFFPNGQPQPGRLGVVVEKPSDTLVDQLDLPKDQGLVIRDVAPDSAAAKAGLKPHDILLEVDGKPVPDEPEALRTMLDGVKADTPVDAVVMRKGRRETIKGLSLPDKAAAPAPGLPVPPPVFPNPNLPPGFPNFGQFNNPGNSVTQTTTRSGDQFTARRQEGDLVITLKGTVKDGKAKADEINIQDGAESKTYDSVDKVPEKYRDKVESMMQASVNGDVPNAGKTP